MNCEYKFCITINVFILITINCMFVKCNQNVFNMTILMKGARPTANDSYLCLAQKVPQSEETLWITAFEPHDDPNKMHHFSLYGCEDKNKDTREGEVWNCLGKDYCVNRQKIYSLTKKPISLKLPDGVGFKIGKGSGVKYLLIQAHYQHPLPEGEVDNESGFTVTISKQRQKYMAGMFLLFSNQIEIPPHRKAFGVDMSSHANIPANFTIFATMIHTHLLGTAVSAYTLKNNTIHEIARRSPQLPDAFYPLDHRITIQPGDLLFARCTYDSTTRNNTTYAGFGEEQEMCNVFFLYYTDVDKGKPFIFSDGNRFPNATNLFPHNVNTPIIPDPLFDEMVRGWIVDNEITAEFKNGTRSRVTLQK